MEYSTSFLAFFLFVVVGVFTGASENPLVPALFIFGDSIFDVGNNNYLSTIVKANHPPYGRDFENHIPTGRFAEYLGFTTSPPAYHKLSTRGKNLLRGVNFASAGSGYYDPTALLLNLEIMNKQLEYYKDCQTELMKVVGELNARSIISDSLYLISSGSNDFVLNYYWNPLLQMVYTVDQFSDVLITSFSSIVQKLYTLGARKICVISLPPIGFLPALINTYCHGDINGCAANMNNDAINFNRKLNLTSQNLQKMFPGLILNPVDCYQTIYEFVTKPYEYGLFEGRRACCGLGLIETIFLCSEFFTGTCANASEYVFWDGMHLTEAASKILVDKLISQAIFPVLNNTLV